ncbi:MAG: FliH/SctL family protein [Bryobacteraceae bacterium]
MSCKILGKDTVHAPSIEWKEVKPPMAAPKPGNLYGAPAEVTPPPARSQHQQQFEAAEQQIAAIRREAEQRIAESHGAGYAEGEAAATRRAGEQLQAKLEQLARAIENLAGFRARFRREAEPELVRLAIAIARRILRRELTVDPDALMGVLKAALEKINSAEVHRIRIHPQYARVVRTAMGGAASQIEIAGDNSVDPGSVLFETSRGSVDAGVETQLGEISRGFADLYPSS